MTENRITLLPVGKQADRAIPSNARTVLEEYRGRSLSADRGRRNAISFTARYM